MAQTGNPTQWGKTEPKVSQLKMDIAEKKLYVIESDGVHGVFFFTVGEDPTYAVIENGCWLSDEPYGTIHRIAGDGSGGIFAACLEFCSRMISHLRIDTHRGNLPMRRALEKAGFTFCGRITLIGGSEDGDPRLAFEKILE